MIGRLRGILLEKTPPTLLVEAGGVGYEVQASMNTFYRLPELGKEITLCTHLIVREDAHQLYGFLKTRERELFRALMRVNGIGPKLALGILSGMEADAFARCVMSNDTASLARLPGIGKKTADRLIIEMRDRLADTAHIDGATTALDAAGAASSPTSPSQDAIHALIALGYKPHDASRAVARVEREHATREDLIRQALKEV